MKRKICFALSLLLALGVFSGCSLKGDNGEDEEITLRWYARINREPDSDEVFKLASEMAKEKIGASLDIIALEDYDTKISVVNASGEDFDIVYTSSVVNNIYQNVSDGNLLPLDELLPVHAPKLWEEVGSDVWDGVKINGKIYAVPNQQIFARGPGFMIPTKNIELLGLDIAAMQNWKLADYESYFRAIKEKTGSYGYLPAAWGGDGAQREGFQLLLGSNLPGAIRYNDENIEVVNQYESQEFQDYIRLRAKWVAEGLTAPMEITENDVSKYKTGDGEVMPWLITMATYIPGCEATYKQNQGFDVTVSTRSEPLLTSYGLVSTMAALNADTRYPEKSVEFLELLNTDPEFYNLIVYGIEGKNYTKTGETSIELSTEHAYTQPAWAIGNTFLGYTLPGQAADVHAQTKQVNSEAKKSPILGFAPDQEEVKLEIANCRAVLDEYLDVLDLGIVDVESNYTAFIDTLKAAGVDSLISKLNAQLEAWKSNQ